MAKTRLLVRHKRAFFSFIKKQVEQEIAKDEVAATYRAAAALVRPLVDAKYSVRDMNVLRKYDAGRLDTCIRLVAGGGNVVGFDFEHDDAPYLPPAYCSSRGYAAGPDVIAAIEAHDAAKDARLEKVREMTSAYRALIHASRTIEDIIEVWPGAREIAEPMMAQKSTALAAVTPEVAALIKSTNIGAQAA